MGSFPGHALPGTFFIIIGFWWLCKMYSRYYNAKRRNSQFTSSAIFSCRSCCGRTKDWPMEAYVKISFAIIGCFVEISHAAFGLDENGYENNAQHATMFFMFGLTGVVDILIHYKAPIPPNMDYISMAIFLASEGLLFTFHLHGRKDLDVLLHTLLVYSTAANAAAVLIEMKYRHSIAAALCRPYFILIQGTWFWQTGWILYPPFPWSFHWDQEDDGQIMIATTIFIWHLAVDFLILLGVGGIVAYFIKRRPGDSVAMIRLINMDDKLNEDERVKLEDDTESEIEYDKSAIQ